MNLPRAICFNLSKRLVLSRHPGDAGENPSTFDVDMYSQWRESELLKQFADDHRAI